jgi:hypothetical protein
MGKRGRARAGTAEAQREARQEHRPRSLADLAGLVDGILRAEQDRDDAVRELRAAGATWVELGWALRVSPQAVQKRFSTVTQPSRSTVTQPSHVG